VWRRLGIGWVEARDLGYDLPACIDRLVGFQQHSAAQRAEVSMVLGLSAFLPDYLFGLARSTRFGFDFDIHRGRCSLSLC